MCMRGALGLGVLPPNESAPFEPNLVNSRIFHFFIFWGRVQTTWTEFGQF